LDKPTGQVRIPVDQAMDLVLQDAAAGKTFYPAKATLPKKEEPVLAVPAPGPAGAAPAATPVPTMPPAASEKK
jgi:hypothetical protein